MSADELIAEFVRTHCNGYGANERAGVRTKLYAIANAAANEALALRDAVAPIAAETPAASGGSDV